MIPREAYATLSPFHAPSHRAFRRCADRMQRQTIIAAMRMQLLGGRSTKDFLSRYWQKKPLLIRDAIPGFNGVIQAPELFRLAGREDVESRIVQRRGGRWRLEHGPFSRAHFARMPRSAWTLLVQGGNLAHPAADALLRRFSFVPYARLDDLMVSYAAPGGGVGPHVDSYDVFLLQARGRRRWRLSRQKDFAFVAGLDLKILARFEPAEEWVLEPGDMLYLPPGVAHDGIAETECLTWSIGFRAPSDAELVAGFLDFLNERRTPAGRYGDARSAPARHPGEMPRALEAHVARVL